VANLQRPGNQTRAVTLALGFGAFLATSLYLAQATLLRQFESVTTESRGNVLFFDIQEDQAAGVDSILRAGGAEIIELTPIVAMRIAAERRVEGILGNSRRRHYGHAALLVASCLAFAPKGRAVELSTWYADLRQRYVRRSAFRQELRAAFERIGLGQPT